MKKRIYILWFALLVIPLILGGCSEKTPMEQAKANIKDISSASTSSTMEIAFTRTEDGEEEPVEVKMEAAEEFTADPVGFSNYMKTSANGSDAKETFAYGVIENGSLMYYYTKADGQWYKEELLTPLGMEISTDDPNYLEPYLLAATDFTPEGDEEVNGRKAVKFTGIINGAAMETFAGLLDNLATSPLGLDTRDCAGLYKKADDIKISFWIDKEQLLPLKYELDATEYMASLIKAAENQGRIQAGTGYIPEKYTVSVNVTGYNNVDSIELPSGAKDAKKPNN